MDSIFTRTELLLGEEGLKKLRSSKIVVMGLGGVGSYGCEILARSGISKFRLVDFDKVSSSNINRQLPALHSTIGKLKTEAMKERILDINPKADVEVYSDFCAQESRSFLIEDADYILDAIDSLGPKVGLLEEAYRKEKKIISSMGAAGRLDPSMIKISDISNSKICPLAKRVRKFLRRRGIASGIPVVYSSEVPIPQFDYNEGSKQEWGADRGRIRGTLSSIGYLPAIMGMWAASYIIRSIVYDYSIYRQSV